MLIVMCGLPGSGKSAMAAALAKALVVPVLSVDPVEAAMWRAGVDRDQPTGLAAYVVVEALAREILKLGQTVIVDAVNDVPEARRQWEPLDPRYIEVVCGDPVLHRKRLEQRQRDIEGFEEPTWAQVEQRRKNFEEWMGGRITVDSRDDLSDNVKLVLDRLSSPGPAAIQYE
ncbi:ATP-binding protein [Kibdelosporangium philippinense]|uniref:ATP-binding protein n=1 Tax=Kibdelosporangium philippinense TaxID=211113 RepID=A0ABS8ZM13_9PSEU|nr:ATP-binding protein [Kibdelosporangium philippinense]MCE7008843.1 ATP-binding protein [Kibdelosporangium philippinense]